jgi:hypothetical protein
MDTSFMHRENERGRVAIEATLLDGGGRCTVVAVHYFSPRRWILYPHGAGKLGVVLSEQNAATLAQGLAQGGR